MKSFKTIILLISAFAISINVHGQSNIKEFSIKKGQVFDIIFIKNRTEPEVKELIQDYFKRAFPIAERFGYHSLGGFGIADNTAGNYFPNTMAVGYWDNLEGRVKFLEAVDSEMPDFHEMRRKIWSTFDLTYYEFDKDATFSVDLSKFNTVTAYWDNTSPGFSAFKKSWMDVAKENGATGNIEFSDGNSPFGYHYNPDMLVITEWESEEAFEGFQKLSKYLDYSAVQHVNQFSLKQK